MTSALQTAQADKVMLDLKYHSFDRVRGDLRAIGTWLFGAGGQCCLVLLPSYAPLMKGDGYNTPCVIPQNEAWRWTEECGEESETYATLAEWGASGALPIDPLSPRELRRAASFIRDQISDLVYMRPAPERQKRMMTGHANVSLNGVTEQREIFDHV